MQQAESGMFVPKSFTRPTDLENDEILNLKFGRIIKVIPHGPNLLEDETALGTGQPHIAHILGPLKRIIENCETSIYFAKI